MKKKKLRKGRVVLLILSLLVVLSATGYYYLIYTSNNIKEYIVEGLNIDHQFLTVNSYSRSGKDLRRVKGIVVHYVANPGSSAQNNRDYFESLKTKHTAYVSSHFVIGLKGEIIQCIPLNEIAYASNNRNKDTISIECCHPDESGQFNNKTYKALQDLVSALMKTYHLSQDDVIRHYDVTGKICPKYFVNHEDAWETFKNSLN